MQLITPLFNSFLLILVLKFIFFVIFALQFLIDMLIVQVKEGESLEKALKKFKKKFEKTGVVKELRERQKFTKPSIKRRQTIIKAAYKQTLQRNEAE